MNEREFRELIERCLSGEATAEEVASVEKWLQRRSESGLYSDLSADEKQKIRTKMFSGLSAKMMHVDIAPVRPSRGSGRMMAYWVAAASILLIGVCTYVLVASKSARVDESVQLVEVVSDEGAVKKVILSDSTIVWLKGNSSIQYPEKFIGPERNIALTGEALFEVSKDPDHPFVIACGGLVAKVLGTSFNIRSSENDIEVLVLTGKVGLSSRGNNPGLIVHPNQKAVYKEAQNEMAIVEAPEREKVEKVAKTEYNMRFHAARMEEILNRISNKFNVVISLSDVRLNNCTITADFTDQSLAKTLSMICQTLAIEYEVDDKMVVLSGTGCDEYTVE